MDRRDLLKGGLAGLMALALGAGAVKAATPAKPKALDPELRAQIEALVADLRNSNSYLNQRFGKHPDWASWRTDMIAYLEKVLAHG